MLELKGAFYLRSKFFRSDEWNLLSAEERKRLNLVFDDDGEFW